MYTANPQLVHILFTGFQLLAILLAIGYAVYLNRWFSKETPSKTLIQALRKEVAQFSGEVADLEDRFSKFQKREGMRHARESKTTQGDLLAEAEQIVANGSQSGSVGTSPSSGPDGGRSPKAALYEAAGLTRRH